MDAVQTDNGICVQALKQQKPRLLLPMIGFLVLVIWGLAATRNLEDSTEFQMSDRRVTPFLQGFYAPETATDGTTYRWTNGLGVIQAQSIRATTHALWRVSVAASPTPLALYLDGLQVLHQQRRIYQVIGATPSWTGAHELRINTIPFADPNEERLLGVRVTDATLVQSGGRLPALFWLGSVFVILACLVTSALVLGWGMGGVVGATVIAALITSSAPLLDVRAAGTWMFTLAGIAVLLPVSVWGLQRWVPRILMTGWAGLLLVRLWGISYPGFEGHDYRIHLRRLSDFRSGIWTMSAHPYEFGRRESVILPLFYRVADGIASVLGTHLAMHLLIICAETSVALVVWFILRRVRFAPRTALIAALLVLLMPLSTSVLYWSFMQQICAHVVIFAIAYLTIHGSRRAVWVAGVLLAVVALTHIGETFIAVIWYAAIRLAEPDRFQKSWWVRTLPAALAGVAVSPLYWSFFGSLGANATTIVQPSGQQILNQMQVAFTIGLAPLPLVAAGIVVLLLLWHNPRLTIPWLSVVTVFVGVELVTRAQVRYLYTGAPLVAVALGWCISPLWRKGFAARLLVVLVVGYIGWVSGALWIDAVLGWQKPRIDGLTH